MCRPDADPTTPPPRRSRNRPRLLLTHDSFVVPDVPDKDDAAKRFSTDSNPHLNGLGGPSVGPTLLTVAFYVACLFFFEGVFRRVISNFSHVDPVLDDERNRGILARHLVADFLSLSLCATLAIVNRSACMELVQHGMALGRSHSMSEDGYAERIFGYHPGAQRLLLFFFVYQVKNMFDSIVWGDGVVFLLHHVFAGAAAWCGMYPGCCHFYSLFYMGFSEISTAILSLLANFDPVMGVAGLEKVFPKTKIVIGALFVASFVVCRVVAWPFVTYHYHCDSMRAMRSDDPRKEGRMGAMKLVHYSCMGLSVIQLVFVGMIIQTGREELAKLMGS